MSFTDEAPEDSSGETPNGSDVFSDLDVDERDIASWYSLAGSVQRHTFENGRRYHYYMQGHYVLPNDEQEQYREELAHLLFTGVLNGRQYLAPIGSNPQKIIDLGTGTGSWAIELADAFPSAEVVGVDLSPIQPDWCPPNLQFHVDNVEDEWAYGSGYDYVHLRHMAFALKNPAALIASAYKNMRSGGWIEFQDLMLQMCCDDCTLPEDQILVYLHTLLFQSLRLLDFDPEFVHRIPVELERAGFTNVHRKIHKVPVGSWPDNKKERYFGLVAREVLAGLLKPLASRPIQYLGLPQSDLNAMVSEAEDTFANTEHHLYINFGVVYAQKP